MTITLSNGVQIEQVKVTTDSYRAVVLPDDREMTDNEWVEYSQVIRQISHAKQIGFFPES